MSMTTTTTISITIIFLLLFYFYFPFFFYPVTPSLPQPTNFFFFPVLSSTPVPGGSVWAAGHRANKEAKFLTSLFIDAFNSGLLYLTQRGKAQFHRNSAWLEGNKFQLPQLNVRETEPRSTNLNKSLFLPWLQWALDGELNLPARSNSKFSNPSLNPSQGRNNAPEHVNEDWVHLEKLFILDSALFRHLILSLSHSLSFPSSAAALL